MIKYGVRGAEADLPGQKEEEARAWSDDGRVLWIRGEGKDEKLNRIRLIHDMLRSIVQALS